MNYDLFFGCTLFFGWTLFFGCTFIGIAILFAVANVSDAIRELAKAIREK